MTNFRIINIKCCKTCKQVALIKQRCDDGDYVEIVAWHEDKEGTLFIQTCNVEFGDSPILIKGFITDFSEFSANQFANSFTF